ncbi:hypothetical protein ACHQM5_023488 [Ranunculus cassubicifolius]
MPPKSSKSKDAPVERPILGRFSSHLKIGIVGLPRVHIPDKRFDCGFISMVKDDIFNAKENKASHKERFRSAGWSSFAEKNQFQFL